MLFLGRTRSDLLGGARSGLKEEELVQFPLWGTPGAACHTQLSGVQSWGAACLRLV